MDERQKKLYTLACIRDLRDAPPDVRLDAARRLADAGDTSAETLEILYAESERAATAGPLLTR